MIFRVGLIGNRAHQNSYGPILQARKDCQIVALAEHNSRKAKGLEEIYGLPCSTDYDEVFENPKVDLVSIAPDFYLKLPLIKKAIDCGKHVLVDKAIARTVKEAKGIVEAAEDRDVKIVLSYPFRFQSDLTLLSGALKSGEYGRVVSYTHHFIRQFPEGDLMEYVSYPTAAKVNGGGELMNLGSHPVDYLYSLFGMPNRVYCHMETAFWGDYYDRFGTEDMATLFCEYSDFTATIVTGRNRLPIEKPQINSVDVTCRGKYVRVDRSKYTINGEPVVVPELPFPSDEACVQHLIDCILNDEDPKTGVSNGLAVAEITTAGYQSAVSREFVNLPLENENHPMIDPELQVVDHFLD